MLPHEALEVFGDADGFSLVVPPTDLFEGLHALEEEVQVVVAVERLFHHGVEGGVVAGRLIERRKEQGGVRDGKVHPVIDEPMQPPVLFGEDGQLVAKHDFMPVPHQVLGVFGDQLHLELVDFHEEKQSRGRRALSRPGRAPQVDDNHG